ncbi:hypothetical protein, partial [Pseudomonas sp.]|uniref:hypothetical protein n=1 Tax=Pseudomonas sp. TaxID=306 RepID=UPI0028AAF580
RSTSSTEETSNSLNLKEFSVPFALEVVRSIKTSAEGSSTYFTNISKGLKCTREAEASPVSLTAMSPSSI